MPGRPSISAHGCSPVRQQGMVLILVLWLVAVMILIVASVVMQTRDTASVFHFSQIESRSYLLARNGLSAVLDNVKTQELREISDEGETYQVIVKAETGRLNINALSQEQLRSVFEPFTSQEQQLDVIVNSILDWRDSDKIKRANGAESSDYRRKKPSYFTADGPLLMVEELRLIQGVAEVLTLEQVRENFTVYGEGKVNLQAAPQSVLELLPGISAGQAQSIVQLRTQIAPRILTRADLGSILSPAALEGLSDWVTLSPSKIYRVVSEGWLEDSNIMVRLTWWLKKDSHAPLRSFYQLLPRAIAS